MHQAGKIPVGISDFTEIRENGYYYIDKTGLLAELLGAESVKVTLITRPRRFGKTLGMSMLASFLDIRRDSRTLFDGLRIMQNESLCKSWMNRYPTLFVTFKDVDGLTFESAKDMLRTVLAQVCNEHFYLLSGTQVNDNDKEVFRQLADTVHGRPTDAMLKTGLSLILHMMQDYYGRQAILLLDEYDVPMAKASQHGYYAQMLELLRTIMSTALKDNTALKLAVVTGCLRVSKESIFTGTNNFVSDTISNTRLNEYFGFVQEEVEALLADTGHSDKEEPIRQWYDGYHFGSCDVYCPWDVLNYLHRLSSDPAAAPISYWKNTSDNAIIRSFIDLCGNSITEKLETLLSGGHIWQRTADDLTYDYLHSSEDNLWSVLYLTGYLTKLRTDEIPTEEGGKLTEGLTPLVIPNAEIREIFETTIRDWFSDYAVLQDRKALFHAAWKGDAEALTQELNVLLRQTISYHDYREDFYHAFLAGVFAGGGYQVESNREHGEGRSDIVVKDVRGGRIVIFEVKYARTPGQLEPACEAALRQQEERMYADEYEDSFSTVLEYGIAFYKKRCLVKGRGETQG